MKTRILSGAVMIVLCVGVLAVGASFPPVLTAFIALLALLGVYEMLHNACQIKQLLLLMLACTYTALAVFSYDGLLLKLWSGLTPVHLTVVYCVLTAALSLVDHRSLTLQNIAALLAFPTVMAYAFSAILRIYCRAGGVYYLLLLLTFSCICDCGAYFTGVTIGRHKLCPEISPKKTVEGAVGGVVWALIVAAALCLTMADGVGLWPLLCATLVFCLAGMVGDLFASVIKRSVGLKDYSQLIPGHGGILDRFDSILLIAPLLAICLDGGLF